MLKTQVQTGQNFSLSLACTSDEQINAGTFVTEVYLAGVPVMFFFPGTTGTRICVPERGSLPTAASGHVVRGRAESTLNSYAIYSRC